MSFLNESVFSCVYVFLDSSRFSKLLTGEWQLIKFLLFKYQVHGQIVTNAENSCDLVNVHLFKTFIADKTWQLCKMVYLGYIVKCSYSETIRAINETPHYFLNDPMSRPYRNTEMKVLKWRRKKHPYSNLPFETPIYFQSFCKMWFSILKK